LSGWDAYLFSRPIDEDDAIEDTPSSRTDDDA